MGTAAEASSGGAYLVAVASERSAADAEAVFRSLQAKFPNQLGGREPIVRRTDLGPEGTYYRASIGPFVSMKAAAGVCSSLKAAGESCLVEKTVIHSTAVALMLPAACYEMCKNLWRWTQTARGADDVQLGIRDDFASGCCWDTTSSKENC